MEDETQLLTTGKILFKWPNDDKTDEVGCPSLWCNIIEDTSTYLRQQDMVLFKRIWSRLC